jgi:transposase InsO family protein
MRILKANKEHRTASNLLERRFDHPTPYEFFCTDITYLYFRGVPSYLSVIKDVASGEVVSFELSRHIDMALVVNTLGTLKQTLDIRGVDSENILIHSDQGSTYTSPIFMSAIAELKMVPSMSRRGNCWDNASIESFFGHLKDDIDYQKCRSFDELKALVSKYIEYYNTERQQWSRKKMTPVEYRDRLLGVFL